MRRAMTPSGRPVLLAAVLLAAVLLSGAGAAAADSPSVPVTLTGQGRTTTLSCGGRDAVLTGDDNVVTMIGPCRSVTILGNRNVVSAELTLPAAVRVTGDSNQVVYAPIGPPAPVTTLRGYYNQVVPGPGDSRPGRLVLDGALGRRDVSCAGLDVVIRESQARYVLRGGCRSVTVEGGGDAIAAELLPSARLVVGGTGVVVNYVLVAQGAPPAVVVTAPGAKATHIARFGESALALPTSVAASR